MLAINLENTSIIQIRMSLSLLYPFGIGSNKKYLVETVNTKFFALQIDNYIMRKIVRMKSCAVYWQHFIQLGGCFSSVKLILSKKNYFAYFH